MTWRIIPVTAAVALSLVGCSFHARSEWRSGSSSSTQTSGSQQPPAQTREPRQGSREVNRVVVRTRPPVDNEARPVQPVPGQQPTTTTPGSSVDRDRPDWRQPPVAADGDRPGSSGDPRQAAPDSSGSGASAPSAGTGQGDTPSSTPETEPASQPGNVKPTKQSGEPHYSPPPKRRVQRDRQRQQVPNKSESATQPEQKSERRR